MDRAYGTGRREYKKIKGRVKKRPVAGPFLVVNLLKFARNTLEFARYPAR
jgi:hypothetical protein